MTTVTTAPQVKVNVMTLEQYKAATKQDTEFYLIKDAESNYSGVEIGDMGFAPLGIDESLNLRRYMNGQVISQTQFVSFTAKIKSAVALFPSLATTEANWQAEKLLSKFGQVGKFVIDDENQTIRLPAVVNAQGLLSLSGIGNLVNESLPNITGTVNYVCIYQTQNNLGAFTRHIKETNVNKNTTTNGGENMVDLGFDASLSSSTYQNNAPVQQEAVQYPYYIQVATGIEETLPAIREYKVNNSDYFGKSMYSDIAPNNASWLASNGSYNARSVYPGYYDWLVEQMNAGVKGFKGTTAYQFKGNTTETESYTPSFSTRNPVVGSVIYGNSPIQAIGYATQVNADGSVVVQDVVNNINATLVFKQELPNLDWFNDYDFVINTSDQTFRLPLLNGEEDLPGSSNETLNLPSSGNTIIATKNGELNLAGINSTTYKRLILTNRTNELYENYSAPADNGSYGGVCVKVKKGDVVAVEYYGYSSYSLALIPAIGNGTLYYYVGDTVQDASLINAGAVLGQLSNKADIDASNFNASGRSLLSGLGMPSNRYIDLTLGASGATYTAPANGYFSIYVNKGNSTGAFVRLVNGSVVHQDARAYGSTGDSPLFAYIPARKGQNVKCEYNYAGAFQWFRFIYAEGEN